MKYEYLKGNAKDFEFCDDGVLTKYRIIGHDTVTHSTHSSKKLTACSLGHVVDIIAERRPVIEPVVNQQLTTDWDGCGLPTVGVECEIKRAIDWMSVTIQFISYYHTVFKTPEGQELCYQTCALQFRPIRSPEDVSRDEAVNAMLNIFGKNAATGTTAAIKALYDAGYRKME